MSFAIRIRPHVLHEFEQAKLCFEKGDFEESFKHLENAHVLGQRSTRLHVLAHLRMAQWAIAQRAPKEFFGQLFRIVGAAAKTFLGLVPSGNTGGSNVSPFKPMPLSVEHQTLIERAKKT